MYALSVKNLMSLSKQAIQQAAHLTTKLTAAAWPSFIAIVDFLAFV